MIDGIHAACSRKLSRTKDQQRIRHFISNLCLAGGDSIDSRLILVCPNVGIPFQENGCQSLSRTPHPEAEKFVAEEIVKEILEEVLMFGEGTYSNIFFQTNSIPASARA